MTRLIALVIIGLLAGCRVTRPDQDNFTIHAGSSGIQPFVAALERRLGTSAKVSDINLPNSDPSRLFELDSNGATVIVNPLPDNRCNPNAPDHATYKQAEYRVDLVYRTPSAQGRQSAMKIVSASAMEAGKTLIPFKEC